MFDFIQDAAEGLWNGAKNYFTWEGQGQHWTHEATKWAATAVVAKGQEYGQEQGWLKTDAERAAEKAHREAKAKADQLEAEARKIVERQEYEARIAQAMALVEAEKAKAAAAAGS